MQAIKIIYWWLYGNFLNLKYLSISIYSILQQNKFITININSKFRILEVPLVDENMDTKIWIP